MSLEKSAGAVVFRREKGTIKYLLLHHGLGHWDFPKGWIEKREELLETAKREIEEETGIKDVEFIPGFKEHIKYFFRWKKNNIFKIVTFFLAKTKTEKVKISYEHTGYKWLSHEKALKQLNHKNIKEVLKKANDFLTIKDLRNPLKFERIS